MKELTIPPSAVKKRLQLGLLIAAGLILFVFEALLPRPLPWFKLGLANLATVLALYRFDSRSALLVTVARVLLGSLIIGTFMTPVFWLAFSAGVGSSLAMAGVKGRRSFFLSAIGVSLIGAVTHNLIQLLAAYWLIVHHIQIFRFLPLLLFPALITGPLIGLLALLIAEKWQALAG
ncbi:MAG TPA: Gx transporter family protein [bacterium]|nr:Gx transporter family protein [bacterium]HPN35017.1 Gx transporter family protein [bacterium]